MAAEAHVNCRYPVLGLVSISCSTGSGVPLQCTGPFSTKEAFFAANKSNIPSLKQPILFRNPHPSSGH